MKKKTWRVRLGETVVFTSAETVDLAIQYAREEAPNQEVLSVMEEVGSVIA